MDKEFGSLKKNKTLVIAIPTLNSENTLSITMDSIGIQKNHNFNLQVVLLDSGSIDKTKEIFFSYQKTLNLNFFNLGKCSIGEARNYAIKNLNTDYLIFLDSDDALTDDRLSQDEKIIDKHQKLDFFYGDAYQINKSSFRDSYYCKSSQKADRFQFLNIPFNLSSLTVKRLFLLENRIYFIKGKKGRLGEDWRFINEVNSFGNYIYDPNPKVFINARCDSHTQDFLRSDLNITKMEFLCSQFIKIKNRNGILKSIFYSFQIQSSLFLALLNIFKYTPRNIRLIKKNIKNIFSSYMKISIINIIINLIFMPFSIYLILFVHRRSIYSLQRASISNANFKKISNKLSF